MMTNSITATKSLALKYRNLAPKKPAKTEKVRVDKLISNNIKVDVICDNALDVDYSIATLVFLYLVQRGSRLIQPVLRRDTENNSLAIQKQQRPKRIISYMNPIEKETITRKAYCKVGNVEEAVFPIYLYHL
jgi:hypothetical protein